MEKKIILTFLMIVLKDVESVEEEIILTMTAPIVKFVNLGIHIQKANVLSKYVNTAKKLVIIKDIVQMGALNVKNNINLDLVATFFVELVMLMFMKKKDILKEELNVIFIPPALFHVRFVKVKIMLHIPVIS